MAGVEHKFTTAYVPWSNGSVERANKEVLRVCRALSSDMRMSPDHWIDLVGLVEAAINHSPTANAAEHAPFTILTGMPPRDQLSAILSEGDTKSHEVPRQSKSTWRTCKRRYATCTGRCSTASKTAASATAPSALVSPAWDILIYLLEVSSSWFIIKTRREQGPLDGAVPSNQAGE